MNEAWHGQRLRWDTSGPTWLPLWGYFCTHIKAIYCFSCLGCKFLGILWKLVRMQFSHLFSYLQPKPCVFSHMVPLACFKGPAVPLLSWSGPAGRQAGWEGGRARAVLEDLEECTVSQAVPAILATTCKTPLLCSHCTLTTSSYSHWDICVHDLLFLRFLSLLLLGLATSSPVGDTFYPVKHRKTFHLVGIHCQLFLNACTANCPSSIFPPNHPP